MPFLEAIPGDQEHRVPLHFRGQLLIVWRPMIEAIRRAVWDMPDPFKERMRRCQASLSEHESNGLVIGPGPNCYYLTGVHDPPSERLFILIVPESGEPSMLVPSLSGEQVRQATWIDDVRTWADNEDPSRAMENGLSKAGITDHVLVDDRLWSTFLLDLQALLPEATFGLASDILAGLRLRKDPEELAALETAARITDGVMTDIRSLGEEVIGLTETDLAREINSRLENAGGDEPSFETIVGAGPSGAQPHHRHSDRTIARGDPVVIDFGCYVDHYPSDQTRTVIFAGEPPEEFEESFSAVRDAQQAGLEAVEPGVTAETVDRAARDLIEQRGYGEAFLHRTGHGVGLEVHEPPYLVEGNEQVLKEGMVFSIEPGVYLEGKFGIRIEDLVVVTSSGVERLNQTTRSWTPD